MPRRGLRTPDGASLRHGAGGPLAPVLGARAGSGSGKHALVPALRRARQPGGPEPLQQAAQQLRRRFRAHRSPVRQPRGDRLRRCREGSPPGPGRVATRPDRTGQGHPHGTVQDQRRPGIQPADPSQPGQQPKALRRRRRAHRDRLPGAVRRRCQWRRRPAQSVGGRPRHGAPANSGDQSVLTGRPHRRDTRL